MPEGSEITSKTTNDAIKPKAIGGLMGLFVAMAALLFLPAWTLDYWQGWAFLAVFFWSAFAITVYLMEKDPELLERRVYAGPTAEKETSQKIIQTITSIGFIAMLVIYALAVKRHPLSLQAQALLKS